MRKQRTKKKSNYKGPYHKNPEIPLHDMKKSMRTSPEGPTVDSFSNIDTTTSYNSSNLSNEKLKTNSLKRPSKQKKKNLFSFKTITPSLIGIFITGGGIFVYNHSNRLVSIEKDIEYIKDDVKENENRINDVIQKNINTDRKLDILKVQEEIRSKPL